MNYHTLTKDIEPSEFIDEMTTAGVTMVFTIAGGRVTLLGDVSAETLAAQLAIVASVETAHAPSTITEADLTAAPHFEKLMEECLAVDGVSTLGIGYPASYPGTVVLNHNSLTGSQKTALIAAAEAHDASSIPSLSVDTSAQVIAANNSATGTVTVTDSRGAAAEGKTVKLQIPPGGSAGVDADSYVLDGSGEATATFQATTVFTGELTFTLFYDSGEADSVTFTVRRGT